MKMSRIPEFKASKGWFVKFCSRFKLGLGNTLSPHPLVETWHPSEEPSLIVMELGSTS